jgi:hypothetical protein
MLPTANTTCVGASLYHILQRMYVSTIHFEKATVVNTEEDVAGSNNSMTGSEDSKGCKN